jgi:hypothetical protein
MAGAGRETQTRRQRNATKKQAKRELAAQENEGNDAVKQFLANMPDLKLAKIVKMHTREMYDICFGEDEPSVRGKLDLKGLQSRKVKRALAKADKAELPGPGNFVIVDWDKAQANKNEARAAMNKDYKKAAAKIIAVVPDEQEIRVKQHAKWGKEDENAVINAFLGIAAPPKNENKSVKRKTAKSRSKNNSNND